MNPFRFGQVVSQENFCPRPELMEKLRGCIESGQNVVVRGERRMGKTSLVFETVRQFPSCRMLHLDLMQIKSVADICRRAARAILTMEQESGFLEKALAKLAHLSPVIKLDPKGSPMVTFESAQPMAPDSLEGILDVIQQAGEGRKLVVFIDEFQDILNLDDAREVLAILRSRIQLQDSIAYIYAGSVRNQMHTIFSDPDSPFFKSAGLLEVGPIQDEAFAAFLFKKFQTGKRIIQDRVLLEVFNSTDRVAGDVQAFCAALWDTSNPGDTITEAFIPAALEKVFGQELKVYEAVLTQLTAQQTQCLRAVARCGGAGTTSQEFLAASGIGTPSSVTRALEKLVAIRVLYKAGNEYRFVNPFFKLWLSTG